MHRGASQGRGSGLELVLGGARRCVLYVIVIICIDVVMLMLFNIIV